MRCVCWPGWAQQQRTAAAASQQGFEHGTDRMRVLSFLQVSTCANVSPVKKPGVKFVCPADTEFNPNMAETFPPRDKACCKVRNGASWTGQDAPGQILMLPGSGRDAQPEAASGNSMKCYEAVVEAGHKQLRSRGRLAAAPQQHYKHQHQHHHQQQRMYKRSECVHTSYLAPPFLQRAACADGSPVSKPGAY